MVVTRSGKNTDKHEARVHECGHTCGSSMVYCCACNDIRPHQATYIAYDQSYMSHASYVGRNHYYCPTCKAKPPTVKIDFSKMKPKPVSAPIVFHPTLEYKLAETEKKLAETEKKLADEIEANKAWESVYRTEIEEWKECYNEAMRTIDTLRQRIRDPFKSAISRPNF
jgi:predicted nucleotide-binding protein (sugar kinase/HSP70/actin superfamily)